MLATAAAAAEPAGGGGALLTNAQVPLQFSPLMTTEIVPDKRPLIFAVYAGTGEPWASGP
jgi:hypothetical protein